MNINDNVPFVFRQLRPQNKPKETACMITRLAKAYGLENIGEIDEQFLNGFTCASEIVIAQLEKEFESDNKGEWIPVSERLPETHQYVLLSLRSLDVEVGFRAETEPYFYCHGADGCYIEPQNVLAWQPLPEPYQKGGE